MDLRPINRFVYRERCDHKLTNYPGLIDAIYLFFFRTGQVVNNYNSGLLKYLRGGSGGEFALVDDYDYLTKTKHCDAADDDVDENCSHLSLVPTTDGSDFGQISRPFRVPIDADKSTFSCKSQGEIRGYTYLSELNIVFKERSAQISELQHALLHTGLKVGVLFRDANGDARLMVDPDYDMKIETSEESGEGATGNASAGLKFSQVSKMPPIYFRMKLWYDWGYGIGSAGTEYVDCVSGIMSNENFELKNNA